MNNLTINKLKDIIREELKIQSKKQVQREKEAKQRSNERKRSWMGDFQSLSNGITQEIVEKDAKTQLLQVKEQLSTLFEALNEEMDSEDIKTFCNRKGFRTWADFLRNLNFYEKAQKGKLFDKSS